MFDKEAEEYANGKGHEHYNYLFEENAGSPIDFARWCFKDGAEFGYNKAKEEIDYLNKHWRSEEERKANEYAKTIIQDLLDNSDEYARQRAYDFLDRPCAKCKHKEKMLTDKKPCKDCDNGCNWEADK